MEAAGQEIPDRPTWFDQCALYTALIDEEVNKELNTAVGKIVVRVNKDLHVLAAIMDGGNFGNEVSLPGPEECAELLDAILDAIWVLIGLGLSAGLPMEAGWNEVARSNLDKIGPDGKVQKRPDGKVLKPEGWRGPELLPMFSGFMAVRNNDAAGAGDVVGL